MPILYRTLSSGRLQCRGTLVWNTATRNAVLIDPTDDATPFLELIRAEELTVKYLLLTHGHVDHAASVGSTAKVLGINPHMHPADAPILASIPKHGQLYGIFAEAYAGTVEPLSHLQEIEIEPLYRFQVLHTPGHTPGSVGFYFKTLGILVSGDTLFQESVGRTDFPGGSFEALKKSIQTVLYTLPQETIVIPGHGPDTQIGHEMRYNPYVRAPMEHTF